MGKQAAWHRNFVVESGPIDVRGKNRRNKGRYTDTTTQLYIYMELYRYFPKDGCLIVGGNMFTIQS